MHAPGTIDKFKLAVLYKSPALVLFFLRSCLPPAGEETNLHIPLNLNKLHRVWVKTNEHEFVVRVLLKFGDHGIDHIVHLFEEVLINRHLRIRGGRYPYDSK